jgi:hypothetical protein
MNSKIPFKDIPKISASWSLRDYAGTIMVRSALGRNIYSVNPGLYRIGNPHTKSEVFISANYKLSFDVLRKSLKGLDAWILILDTKGVNVWCAAGKGTFGTKELIRQIRAYQLEQLIETKRLIVPQLGAPGVSAHEVKKETGFKVVFGPVRAADIRPFLDSGLKATEEMRSVKFGIVDRLILTPVEISNSLVYLILVIIFFFLLSGLSKTGYSFQNAINNGILPGIYIVTAYLSGAFLTPILLPWLPSRYFALKGMITSIVIYTGLIITGIIDFHLFSFIGWLFISMGIASFLAMNFTGASTYTSLSGVKKEMRIFIPVQILLSISGFVLVIISNIWA